VPIGVCLAKGKAATSFWADLNNFVGCYWLKTRNQVFVHLYDIVKNIVLLNRVNHTECGFANQWVATKSRSMCPRCK
jgi:hypothetical protein